MHERNIVGPNRADGSWAITRHGLPIVHQAPAISAADWRLRLARVQPQANPPGLDHARRRARRIARTRADGSLLHPRSLVDRSLAPTMCSHAFAAFGPVPSRNSFLDPRIDTGGFGFEHSAATQRFDDRGWSRLPPLPSCSSSSNSAYTYTAV